MRWLTSILLIITLIDVATAQGVYGSSELTSIGYPGASMFLDLTWSPEAHPQQKLREGLVWRYLSIALFIPFKGGFAYLIGPFNESGMHVGETYVELNVAEGLGVRLGTFRSRYGRMNEKHLHALNFTSHPLALYTYLGASGLKGTGVALTYLMPTDTYWEIEYERYIGGAGTFNADHPVDVLRSRWSWEVSDDSELMLSLSWAEGMRATGAKRQVYGFNLSYYWLHWEERLYRDLRVDLGVLSSVEGARPYGAA